MLRAEFGHGCDLELNSSIFVAELLHRQIRLMLFGLVVERCKATSRSQRAQGATCIPEHLRRVLCEQGNGRIQQTFNEFHD